ncbi:MAG: hypothetical protein J6L62_03070, partial [Clostridia bacterium]|nr:hypothetical protein [Clostridia bacterium]
FAKQKTEGYFMKSLSFCSFFVKISPSHDFVVPAPFRQGGLIAATLKTSSNPNWHKKTAALLPLSMIN